MSTLLRPADAAVVAIAVVAVVATGAALWTPRGDAVVIEIRGPAGTQRHALADDAIHRIPGTAGDSVVEIRDGRARFVGAPCHNRVCIAAGWLANADDFAACIPNGVSLRITGSTARYDAIAH